MIYKEALEERKSLAVCATCPWRKQLQGTKHPAGWYKLTNIKRLWNGIRTGNAPGMVCHSSDPGSIEYGSTKVIPENVEKRECAGALQLIYHELHVVQDYTDLKEYRKRRVAPFTKAAIAHWFSRTIFGKPPAIVTCDDVGLPWNQDKDA